MENHQTGHGWAEREQLLQKLTANALGGSLKVPSQMSRRAIMRQAYFTVLPATLLMVVRPKTIFIILQRSLLLFEKKHA
jgi:hypothetical protein